MKTLVIMVLTLVTVPKVFSQQALDFKNDAALSNIFTPLEIKGLEAMVVFVDDMVTERTNTTQFDTAYHRYLEMIATSTEYIVPFKEAKKYAFLKSLDSAQFSAVWRFDSHVDVLMVRDTVYRNLDNFPQLNINPVGKYMDYLEEVGKEDPYFDTLGKHFKTVGNLSAAFAYEFPKYHANFDFNMPKNRLWAAIFLLNKEETYETKLNRYLKQH